MTNKEIIKLDKVPKKKEKISFELKVKLGVNWNYNIVENTMIPTDYKSSIFFKDYKSPKDFRLALYSYVKCHFEQMDGVGFVEFSVEEINIPKVCEDSYDKSLKAHAESEKIKVKKEIEELENKAKQLKEKLKKL